MVRCALLHRALSKSDMMLLLMQRSPGQDGTARYAYRQRAGRDSAICI